MLLAAATIAHFNGSTTLAAATLAQFRGSNNTGCRYNCWLPLQLLTLMAHSMALMILAAATVAGCRYNSWLPLQLLNLMAHTTLAAPTMAQFSGYNDTGCRYISSIQWL